jgi:S1-C subfamily serine protease
MEGTSVFAYGYPTSWCDDGETLFIRPRVTAGIVSSQVTGVTLTYRTGHDKFYVVDFATGDGNSGGPLVASETGEAHGIITGSDYSINTVLGIDNRPGFHNLRLPAPYSLATRLSVQEIRSALEKKGIVLSS